MSEVKDKNELDLNSTLRMLHLFDINMDIEKQTASAFETFKKSPDIPGIVLTEKSRFKGMISRKNFFEIMGKPFSLELFLKRPIETVFQEVETESIVFPADTLISEALDQALQRPTDQLYEPLVVAFDGTHFEILDIDQLLIAQSVIYRKILDQLKISMNCVNNLLDNSGEGFLTFGEDLKIEFQYSAECLKIFGKEIEGISFPELVFSKDKRQVDYLAKLLNKIFKIKDDLNRKIYFPLLPEEIIISEKYINLKYKIIYETISNEEQRKFMVVLTDITEKRKLENQIEKEKNVLKMVVKVVVYFDDYIECMKDYRDFNANLINSIKGSQVDLNRLILEIYRNVHTFKGNFSQLDFINVVINLHDFETDISKLGESSESITRESLIEFVGKYDMLGWLEQDLSILKKILGEKFFKKENCVSIGLDTLKHIEDMIKTLMDSEEKEAILHEFEKLQSKSLKEMLKNYPDYTIKLSEKYEKPIRLFDFEGEDILIGQSKYAAFCKTLVHVFRNIIEHGIEPIDQRIEAGKDEYGNIKCEMKMEDDNIVLSISDDGRGIDIEKIKETIIKKGLYDKEELSRLSKREIINMIFLDNFSTLDEVSTLAGRGIGLAAVFNEIKKIGGNIRVESELGKGTGFYFYLPIHVKNNEEDSDFLTIKHSLLLTITKYFEEINIDLLQVDKFEDNSNNRIYLKTFNSFIAIRSKIIGKIIISLEYRLVKYLLNKFFPTGIQDGDENIYMEDIVSEFLNTILGNSTQMLFESGKTIAFGTPCYMRSIDAIFKIPQTKRWNYNLKTTEGDFNIYMFSSN